MDKNNKFYIPCKECLIDLEKLLKNLINLNLSEQEESELKYKESEQNVHTIYVKKRKMDYLFKLWDIIII